MGVDGTVVSYNLFAYCGNNPVMGYDPTGQWDWGVFAKVAVTTVIVAACLTGVGAIAAAAATVAATSVTAAVTTAVATATIATTISAVDGALCAQESGGSMLDGALAGAIGGSLGALVSSLTNPAPGSDSSLRMNTAGRAVSSLAFDMTYELFDSGSIKANNVVGYAVDVTMDVALSPIAYYYSGNLRNGYTRTVINGVFDGIVDVFQSVAYFS